MATTISERDFQSNVIDLAHLLGWVVAHFRPARTKNGWATPVAADGKGFPDLILVHAQQGRTLAVELKADRKDAKVTAEQQAWLRRFAATSVEVDVWRPADLDDIGRILSGSPTRGRTE